MPFDNNGRLELLKDIRDSKHIIFSMLSDKCTKIKKINAWKAIHEKALSLGLVSEQKDYTYTRDTLWQNLKKSTLRKFVQKKRPGNNCKLNELDHIILSIIRKHTSNVVKQTNTVKPPTLPLLDQSPIGISPAKNVVRLATKSPNNSEELLCEKKLNLAVEIMEKESYLKSLEIFKLEKELGLPGSKFTWNFSTKQEIE